MESIYTIAMTVTAAGMTIIAGISAYLYRQRDGQFEAAAKQVNELTAENKEYETALATSEETVHELENTIEYYLTRCDQLQQEIDTLRRTVTQYEEWCNEKQQTIDLLKSERATLYRRNEKGQIVPITPKPRKPHTLKHGMTVKDPTPKQAEMIFREAKRAGIQSNEERDLYHKKSRFIAYTAGNRLNPKNIIYHSTFVTHRNTYITATEFVKRIKGEVA